MTRHNSFKDKLLCTNLLPAGAKARRGQSAVYFPFMLCAQVTSGHVNTLLIHGIFIKGEQGGKTRGVRTQPWGTPECYDKGALEHSIKVLFLINSAGMTVLKAKLRAECS